MIFKNFLTCFRKDMREKYVVVMSESLILCLGVLFCVTAMPC